MFVYSSYHLNISFPSSGSHFNKLEQVLETHKNGFVSTLTLWITLNKTNPGKNITNNFTTQIKLPPKILANFSYPKKIPESKISNPKKSFDHPRHLKSRVPPLGVKCKTKELYTGAHYYNWSLMTTTIKSATANHTTTTITTATYIATITINQYHYLYHYHYLLLNC